MIHSHQRRRCASVLPTGMCLVSARYDFYLSLRHFVELIDGFYISLFCLGFFLAVPLSHISLALSGFFLLDNCTVLSYVVVPFYVHWFNRG